MKITALRKLYNTCQTSLNKEPKDPTEREIGYSICLMHMMRIMDSELFELERDQIVDSWCAGIEDEPMIRIHGERYFNSNYISNK